MTKKSTPFFTDTVKRFTAWNVLVFLLIILLFNIFLITVIGYTLNQSIDIRLKHEMENIIASLDISDSSITITDFSEFNEPDLSEITETPYFLQIYTPKGEVLITSKNLKYYKSIPTETEGDFSSFTFKDIEIDNDQLRVGFFSLMNDSGERMAVLQLATFETRFTAIFNNLVTFNLYSFPILIIIIIFASIFLARKSVAPIDKIIATAERISAGNLNTRIDYKAKPDDELGRLRDTLNQLFDRIELNINRLSQFTDHASHQMMNPLTAVKTELEYILKKERSDDEYREALNKLLIQTDQMIKIVRTLLMISKQNNDSDKSQSVFNFSNLIQNIIITEFAKDNIQSSIEKEVYVKGDTDKFYIVVENLVDNAIKYSNSDKIVIVTLTKNGSVANLIVKDNGIGISDIDKAKVFDRFYRSEKAERLGIKGNGLGLSLVKLLIEEAGGNISVKDNEPGGTIFIVTLPYLALT
jgi:signal transduction histidine kinase